MGAKPVVAFLTNAYATDLCFAPDDLERLAGVCEVRATRPERVEPDDIAVLGRGADVWVTGWGTPSLPAAAFASAPRLRLLCHSAGSTRYLLPADFWTRGIALMTANGALAVDVAETTFGFLIASGKRLWQLAQHTRQGRWGWAEQAPYIKEFYGKTLGVVSASQVGRNVLRIAGVFSLRRVLYDPYVDAAQAAELGAEKIDDLLELARQSDFLVVCAPALDATRRLIDRDVLRALPDDCILVNPSRGSVIDEAALIEELRRGRLFACLDVTDPEPPAEASPLRSLPNVILTPHVAGAVSNGCRRQGRYVVDDILRFVAGRRPQWLVEERQWAIMA